MKSKDYYIGNITADAAQDDHGGWVVGTFMEDLPRKTELVEIKYWNFKKGPTDHAAKISGTLEITLIINGSMEGLIAGKKITLHAGEYVVISPGVVNNLSLNALKDTVGLTIKAPSDPTAKKIVKI